MACPDNIQAVASHLPNMFAQETPPILSPKDVELWKKLGFCEELTKSHPECVKFLFSARLAFSMAMFRNTFGSEVLERDVDGHPMIKMDGQWTRLETVQEKVEYNSVQEGLIVKGQPAIGCNYIHPEGIVQKHHSKYEELYAVGQLAQDELENVRATAGQFFETNPEIDPGDAKECILQIVSTRRDFCPRNWFTENILDNAFEHIYLRLVDKEGKVYSFSFKMSPMQASMIWENLPFSFLTTAVTNVSTPDYEETRKFDERRVTSVPLTNIRKEVILDFINTINKGDIPFNYAKQNCAKLAQIVLGLAGVEVNSEISFGDLLWRALPSPSKLPGVGIVFATMNKVRDTVYAFFDYLISLIPACVKEIGSYVIDVVLFIPRKIQAVFTNTLALILGAAGKTPAEKPDTEHVENIENNNLSYFKRMIADPVDFFDEKRSDSHFSGLIVEWQLQQKSTKRYSYIDPRMYL